MNDKVNEFFDDLDQLCCREFDQQQTLELLHLPQPSVFWSWGVSRKIKYKSIGLLLHVAAHRHTGWILISLSFADLYDVYLLAPDKRIKKSIKGLYFDQLREAIDNEIEKIDDYQF